MSGICFFWKAGCWSDKGSELLNAKVSEAWGFTLWYINGMFVKISQLNRENYVIEVAQGSEVPFDAVALLRTDLQLVAPYRENLNISARHDPPYFLAAKLCS